MNEQFRSRVEAGLQKIAASLTKKSGVKQEDKVHQHIGRLNRYENFTMPWNTNTHPS